MHAAKGRAFESHSRSELVLAARGQTMSFAVYPRLGAIIFGSDASATKVLDLT